MTSRSDSYERELRFRSTSDYTTSASQGSRPGYSLGLTSSVTASYRPSTQSRPTAAADDRVNFGLSSSKLSSSSSSSLGVRVDHSESLKEPPFGRELNMYRISEASMKLVENEKLKGQQISSLPEAEPISPPPGGAIGGGNRRKKKQSSRKRKSCDPVCFKVFFSFCAVNSFMS